MFGISAFSVVPLSAIPVVGGGGNVYFVNVDESFTLLNTQDISSTFFVDSTESFTTAQTVSALFSTSGQISEAVNAVVSFLGRADFASAVSEAAQFTDSSDAVVLVVISVDVAEAINVRDASAG